MSDTFRSTSSRRVTSVCAAAVLGTGIAFSMVTTGCTTAPKTESGRADLKSEAAATLSRARTSDPSLGSLLDKARGYAVFPTVGKGAVGVGGAYGQGALYQGGAFIGYCDLSQGSVGFQLGGQAYSEIIAFETTDALNTFKSGNFAFSAQATAVALKSGAGANAKYDNGVAVFTMGESGLMYEASIGGQKFSFQPE